MTRWVLLLALGVAGRAHAQEETTPTTLVDRFDFEHRIGRVDVPGRLDEISGLAVSASGRLFGHNDERGVVYALDPTTGAVGRGFEVGAPAVRDDFEGLAVAGERFFLVSSRGRLYEFREAPQGGSSPVRVTDTGVGASCEVEGLTWDPRTDALLLACKTVRPDAPEVRIHSLPLDPSRPIPPPLVIAFADFAQAGLEHGFHPSGLDVDPVTGTLVLVGARQEAIAEIDAAGKILCTLRFPGRRHRQPEGIAFGSDGRLYIADEADGDDARLTIYGPPAGGEGP